MAIWTEDDIWQAHLENDALARHEREEARAVEKAERAGLVDEDEEELGACGAWGCDCQSLDPEELRADMEEAGAF